MNKEKDAYRQVFKATSLFGGVQLIEILIAVVRSKAIALLFGSYGMGISGLLNTTLNFIHQLTGAGIDRSAVKDISEALGQKDEKKIVRILGVTRRLVWFTGTFGAVIAIAFSGILSQWAFDSNEFTFAFVWIGVAVFFRQLSYGNLVLLQGLRKLQSLAKANLSGSIIGLFVVLPLYYWVGIKSIAPAIAISYFLAFIFSRYYANKVTQKPEKVSTKVAFSEGKPMLKLGIMMSVSSLLLALSMFLVQLFVSNTGGVSEVGFYHAGVVIINSYVGMIFNAMSKDYYPRLAAIANDIQKIREIVMHQAYIAVLIITPIIILFLIFSEMVVILLYSSAFLPVVAFLSWAILGTLFKAVSFSMAYIIIAKGDSKLFIKTALFFNLLLFIFNILGYYYGGLVGLGISFFAYYLLYLILIGIITKQTYNFYFPRTFYGLFLMCLVFAVMAFGFSKFDDFWIKNISLIILLFLSGGVSLYLLNKKMDLKEVVVSFLSRRNKH